MRDSDQHDLDNSELNALSDSIDNGLIAAFGNEGDGSAAVGNDDQTIPSTIGRYAIERVLGKGAFGKVYLGHDTQLERLVAIKVPHHGLNLRHADVESYFAEARMLASLDHPNIVTVHDVGRTPDIECYTVSKYVDGASLSELLKKKRFHWRESAAMVATVAEALHHAHKRGLVHRDIKPGNLLVDQNGQIYVADFGIALREFSGEQPRQIVGTPAYMSPEQARGEGHRVDGRSDVYSLGVVLYELLVGRPPFHANSVAKLLSQTGTAEAKPPRQIDETIPLELERICLKAMASQCSDRYTTAYDFAQDLRELSEDSMRTVARELASSQSLPSSPNSSLDREKPIAAGVEGNSRRIIPKGLRSFDQYDADFFLDLLPGLPDKHGIPPNVSFWKSRIDEIDGDETFSVGVMYGPSGCGKSSLVNAGILPRLGDHVVSICVEATPDDTEIRLLKRLSKRVPDIAVGATELTDVIRRLRDRSASGRKALIVLDQFEQWLHRHGDESNQQLIHALRQCDGGKVQCLLLIRDDFWTPMSRFMRQLDIPLVEYQTMMPVDLFSIQHAEKVLTKIGQAYGALPETLDGKNQAFVSESAMGLASDGKVICVRLSLFAQMMQDKPWTPDGLKAVGGTEGVGVRFLEEKFSVPTAAMSHRVHQKAARAVLESLLPKSGSDIKGSMRSHHELIEVSGYAKRRDDFDQLIRILDQELRLITPTDPDMELNSESVDANDLDPTERYYQLTHDYLVPSVREWLTRKRQETRKGRAELRLMERAAIWQDKPERRHMPSAWEWLNIRALTQRADWTESQKVMMRKTGQFHFARMTLAIIVLGILGWLGLEINGRIKSSALVDRLKDAHPNAILPIIDELKRFRRWASDDLRMLSNLQPTNNDERRYQLHARMALVRDDELQVAPLKVALLSATPDYLGCIRDVLSSRKSRLELWQVLRDQDSPISFRFNAGIALATYAVDAEEDWNSEDVTFLAKQLVSFDRERQPTMRDHLRPIASRLLAPLEVLFADQDLPDNQRLSAASALKDYARDDARRLARLLIVATPAQYEILFDAFSEGEITEGMTLLQDFASTKIGDGLKSNQRLELARQRASAAITLLRCGKRADIVETLRVTGDPETMTQLIHRCRAREVGIDALLDCLKLVDESRQKKIGESRKIDDRMLYAFILALGEYQYAEIASAERASLVEQLLDWLKSDPSSAIHGATSWLLRRWGHHERVREIEEREVPFSADREWFTIAVRSDSIDETNVAAANSVDRAASSSLSDRFVYFHFVVFPPGRFIMGEGIDVKTVVLTRPFAVADREITWEQFELAGIRLPSGQRYRDAGAEQYKRKLVPTRIQSETEAPDGEMGTESYPPILADDTPAFGVNWFAAVEFCRAISTKMGIAESEQSYADPESLEKGADGYPIEWPLKLPSRGMRLLTSAEWEYVSRCGIQATHSFGDDRSLLSSYGWFDDNSEDWSHPGRLLRPNHRGLFDIHGNQWEWCHDWYETPDNPMTDRDTSEVDPIADLGGSNRVGRGGCWGNSSWSCRSANRFYYDPKYGQNTLGFRVALTLPSPPSGGDQSEDAGGLKLSRAPIESAHAATPVR